MFHRGIVAIVVVIFSTTISFAQSADDIIRLFGGMMQNAVSEAARVEWEKLPQNQLSCIDNALRQDGAELAELIRQAVKPSDPRIASLRSDCRKANQPHAVGDISETYLVANTRPPDAYLALRSEPSSSLGQRLEKMPNGTPLQVLQRRTNGWWRVRLISSGVEGWALSRAGTREFIVCCAAQNITTPSFDCAKSRYPDEKAICQNAELATLDRQVASAYEKTRAAFGDQRARAVNVPLFQARRACGSDVNCIKAKQIATLEALRSLSGSDQPKTQNQVGKLLWEHNGSTVYLEASGSVRKFYYENPRPGMLVAGAKPGTLLFEGEAIGTQYRGTAYVFKGKCGKIGYAVAGPILREHRRVELRGRAPRVDENCDINGYVNDVLDFQLIDPAPKAESAIESGPTPIVEENLQSVVARIQSRRTEIEKNRGSLRDENSRARVNEIVARAATANAETSRDELKRLEEEIDVAKGLIAASNEFVRVSAIADDRSKLVSAALDRVTSDGPIVRQIQDALKALHESQSGSDLGKLQSRLRELNTLFDANRSILKSMEFDSP